MFLQRAHNFTMPAWLTQQVFDNLTMFVGLSQDFLAGLGLFLFYHFCQWKSMFSSDLGGFGEGEETELIMLRGGNMLKQMIADMQTAIDCDSNPSCINAVKYIAYSGVRQPPIQCPSLILPPLSLCWLYQMKKKQKRFCYRTAKYPTKKRSSSSWGDKAEFHLKNC